MNCRLRHCLLPIFLGLCITGGQLLAQTKTGPVNIDQFLRGPVTPDRAKAYYHFSVAKVSEKERNWETAEAELQKAINLDPDSSVLRSEAAEFFLRIRRVNTAIRLCQEALDLDKNNADAHYLLASIYSYVSGDSDSQYSLEDAIREYREVIRIAPKHPIAQYRLGQIYLDRNEADKAAHEFEEYNHKTGGHQESYYFLAMAYESLDRLDDALLAVQKALKIQPSSQGLELLNRLLGKVGKSGDAVSIYRKILQENENSTEIKRRLASSLRDQGQFDEAISLLEEVVEQQPEDLSSRMQLGRAYFSLRKFDLAADAFEAALKLDPKNIRTRFYIAYVHEERGETKEALMAFQSLLDETYKPSGKYDPREFNDRMLFQRHIAYIYRDAGELEKAVEQFRDMLSQEDRPENYRDLINTLSTEHRIEEALKLNEEALGKYPQDKFLILSRAQLLSENGGFEKGEKISKELIAQNPVDLDYYVALSQIYLQAKHFDQAEETLKRALTISDEHETIQFQLGAVYERSQSYKKAEKQFQEILEKNPRNANALNYLGYMWADLGIRLQEALEHIKRAVDLDPKNGAYLDSLGWVYFKLDQFQKAEEYLQAAVRRVRNDPTIHEHLGDLYYKQGLYSEAEGAWREALSHGTEDEEIQKVKQKLERLKKVHGKGK